MFFWAKYGVQTTFRFPIPKRGVVDLAATADWTPATGDTKVSKDGGAVANTTNNPAAVTGTGSVTWGLTLTAAELTAAEIDIQIVDSATKAVEDQFLVIYTYGNASAKIATDMSDSVRMGLTALPNVAVEGAGGLFTRGTGAGQINQDANGRIDANLVATKAATPYQPILHTGTAQAGAAGTITLASGASATDNIYRPCRVTIISGTGAGQSRQGTAYVGSTKVLTVTPNWVTNPSTDSVYQLEGSGVDVESWLNAAPGALVSGAVPASADVVTWRGTQPNALVSNRVDASVGAIAAGAITAASIATDAVDADAVASDALTEIAAAVWAKVIEVNGSYTAQQAQSIVLAFAAGITSGGGVTIKDPAGTATRIAATIDGSNNRTAMTLTPSA
jgi:VCBS repeat-containing protein